MIKILFFFLIPLVCISQTRNDLIGSWQAAPHVAAGYDDTYTFNSDGTFYYFNNQMDCSEREIGFGGYWELEGKTINLTVTYSDLLKGGYYEPSDGSCASDSMLVDAVQVKQFAAPYELSSLKITEWKIENEDGYDRQTAVMNNAKYWYFSKFDY